MKNFKYEQHPFCNIEVERTSRIIFSPKKEGEKIPDDLTQLSMPAKDFWEGLSSFLHSLDDEMTGLRRTAAIQQSMILQLNAEQGENQVKKKVVYVGSDKKAAFFAGITLGRKQVNK